MLRRPYSRILVPQDEGGFTAEVLEFPGCVAEGETAEEANAKLEEAAISWIIGCAESGKAVPDPLGDYQGSGKFALRLPRSLQGRAVKAATRDGVSLNQFITYAVAEKLGASTAAPWTTHWAVAYPVSYQTLHMEFRAEPLDIPLGNVPADLSGGIRANVSAVTYLKPRAATGTH
jgi:predicted RNase H-like HicB family nuclease